MLGVLSGFLTKRRDPGFLIVRAIIGIIVGGIAGIAAVADRSHDGLQPLDLLRLALLFYYLFIGSSLIKEERHSVPRSMFACLTILLAIAGCSRELPPGERNNFHVYGVGHASLHFEYFGDTRGTEDLYEDSSGLREAHIVHSELITAKAFHPTITYTVRDVSHVPLSIPLKCWKSD